MASGACPNCPLTPSKPSVPESALQDIGKAAPVPLHHCTKLDRIVLLDDLSVDLVGMLHFKGWCKIDKKWLLSFIVGSTE